MPGTDKLPGPAGDRLRVVFLLATLKPSRSGREFSHTDTLCKVVAECLRSHNVACEIVRLVDYDIKPGIRSNMGKGDEWPGIPSRRAIGIGSRHARRLPYHPGGTLHMGHGPIFGSFP